MKTLEQKNTRYLLIWLPVVLLGGSLLFLAMLYYQAGHMQEKQLELKQQNVWKAFTKRPDSLAARIVGEYDLEEVANINQATKVSLRDTSLFYRQTGQWIDFQTLTQQYKWKGTTYRLTTYVSSKEISHLVIKVFIAEILIFSLLLLSIVVINRRTSRRLWLPFYDTLLKADAYDVVRNPVLDLEKQPGIVEFTQLNNGLEHLVEKVNKAYNNQKQFVENASHEMQTPLAIIRSKLELMMNDPLLTERTATFLGDITIANERLSQLNKSLLLLAKIDNNQFPEQSQVCISDIFEKALYNYQQYYEEFPVLEHSIKPNVSFLASPSLIEIMINNLIANAVVHNVPGGYIKIFLDEGKLFIENSGKTIEGEPERLFERFNKGDEASKTTGLGLALVKQIALLYKINLQYHYENGLHRITAFLP